MNTGLKSRGNDIFHLPVQGAEKNDRRGSPINDDLTSANTWGTPKISRFTRRDSHHDA